LQLSSYKDIGRQYRHIFLSPHPDDVVYSCGGTLGVQVSSGIHPLIITVFAGIPAPDTKLSQDALQRHRQMGFSDVLGVGAAAEGRRQEDAAACDYLEADYLWLNYLDASYRGNPPYYATFADIISGKVHAADAGIERQLAEDLLAINAQLPDVVWYAPLGIGHHVDHLIVCSAADHLVQNGARVYFYEDFPYVVRESGALEARLQELGNAFDPALVEVSEFIPARQSAASMYTSQIQQNFPNEEAMHKAIAQYAHGIRPVETVSLERYWTPLP
jgi:LmbE family N-acetylglucosaminyl deacetylase